MASVSKEANSHNTHRTTHEAEIEYLLALSCAKRHYPNLNFESALAEEDAMAHGKDNLHSRVPAGLMRIRPGSHNAFYSILAPVSAAIAARNCVAVHISQDLSLLNRLLRKPLTEALNVETLAILHGIERGGRGIMLVSVQGTQPRVFIRVSSL